ncbi:winged helix-turn-helix domain-containing protein [Streptomyces sp. NPDC005827]|uniref:AfsR/SARP family transcriptional regulator n=1 Tax=Streptomyces sp. NPDC005827 TaxID=3157070 RepID=UPI003402A2BD
MDDGSRQLFRVVVLGPLRVWREGILLSLGAARQQALFAALLLREGATVSRVQLVEDVWGTEPPRSSHATLHAYVSRLRRLFRAQGTEDAQVVIRQNGSGYVLTASGTGVDVSDLAGHVRKAQDAMSCWWSLLSVAGGGCVAGAVGSLS